MILAGLEVVGRILHSRRRSSRRRQWRGASLVQRTRRVPYTVHVTRRVEMMRASRTRHAHASALPPCVLSSSSPPRSPSVCPIRVLLTPVLSSWCCAVVLLSVMQTQWRRVVCPVRPICSPVIPNLWLTIPVRAFYILNSVEPYLLARSSSKVDVSIIPQSLVPGGASDEVIYGKVALRPCLEAICQSRCVSLSSQRFLSHQPATCMKS